MNRPPSRLLWTRRRWLAGVSLLGVAAVAGDDPKKPANPPAPTDPAEVALQRAKKAGLKEIRSVESAHYFGIGDANDDFRRSAVELCEKLATSYQTHFQKNGFEVALPKERMTIVILASRSSYEKFSEEPVDPSQWGHYDIESDCLVTFDSVSARNRANAARIINTFTLVHEAIHQLTYATGLLSRKGDVPVALSEAFATYCESWQLSHQVIGDVNRPRLQVLAEPGAKWLPLSRLLAEDDLFHNEATTQAAYAESWLLMHALMDKSPMRQRLRSYLDTIRTRVSPSKRIQDAETALGDLDRLDETLQANAASLLSRAKPR
jgi:hypothetical protein